VFSKASHSEIEFHEASELTPGHIRQVESALQRRVLRYFRRHGLLDEADAAGMLTWQGSGGFSVDASVRIEGEDRAGIERLSARERHPFGCPPMGLAVKRHSSETPSALRLTAGVRFVSIAGSTHGEGLARRVRIAVRKALTAAAFSVRGREPSSYQGLCGPSLRSALQGRIAYPWGLGPVGPAQKSNGCSPL